MHAERSSAADREPWRTRVRARLSAERGDTLIEVVVGALMVGLIATAVLGGFSDITALSQSQRAEDQAASLAQQDQARLRGLTITQLASSGTGTGNTSSQIQVGSTIYTVTSTSQFISGSTGAAACSGGSADEVQTTSAVTWGPNGNNGGRTPVVVHGLITPAEGGSLTANVDTIAGLPPATAVGAAGATVSLSGPTSVTPITVNSSGCAAFSGLSPGTYTVSYTAPPTGTWVVYPGGATTIPTQSVVVVASQTKPATTVYLAQPGNVAATFQTAIGSSTYSSAADTFVLFNSQLTPTAQVIGTDSTKTNNSFATTLTSPTTIMPFPSTMAYSYLYSAYAGGCTADAPTGTNAPQGFTVAPNTTTNVTVNEPAMVILPYTETATTPSFAYDDTNAAVAYSPTTGWTHNSGITGPYQGTESDTSTASTSDKVTVTIPLGTTSFTYYATTKSSYGYATVGLTGQSNTNVSLYSSTTQYHQAVYTSPTLSATTQYTLTITYAGTKPSGSSGYTIDVDEITGTSATVYGAPTLMSTAPDVTLIDTLCSNNEDYPPTTVPSTTTGALLYPGVYDTTYTVCVDNGTNHYSQTVTAATLNANFNTGTTVNAYIYPGAPAPPGGGTGYGTGVCT